MSLVVKTAQEPAALATAVRAEIRKMDPNLPIPAIRTMREILSQTVAERRFQMVLTVLFALTGHSHVSITLQSALVHAAVMTVLVSLTLPRLSSVLVSRSTASRSAAACCG